MKVVGDRYFIEMHRILPDQRVVLTGRFANDEPPIELPIPRMRLYWGYPSPDTAPWVGTAEALYWSDGKSIYRQPLPKD
jgi:hypothetical protein